MKDLLIENGILLPNGEICKNKINLVSGAMTQPFAEMVWGSTGGDKETLNRLTDILVTMNTDTDRDKLFKLIQMLYGLMGVKFPDEAFYISRHKEALKYFIFSFIADFGEIIQEYISNGNR
ncbi:MAG: hypothetical protein Q4G33_01170 [bacterium]|nr:hypothetical protein [bacterium]